MAIELLEGMLLRIKLLHVVLLALVLAPLLLVPAQGIEKLVLLELLLEG